MRASVRGRDELAVTGSAGVGSADQEGSRAYRQCGDRQLGGDSAQQSGDGWVHAQAEQLWQILSPSQTGDS